MLSPAEDKILRKLSKQQLVSRLELVELFKSNGYAGDPRSLVDVVTNGLVEKKYISSINPVGSICFVITQKGTSAIDGK